MLIFFRFIALSLYEHRSELRSLSAPGSLTIIILLAYRINGSCPTAESQELELAPSRRAPGPQALRAAQPP